MPRENDRVRRLLRSLDEPDNLEFPAGYDHRRTRDRFDALARHLEAAFGPPIVDRDIQDAGAHGRITITAAATATGAPLVITISNFGGLAALGVGGPGPWTDAARLLHHDDARAIAGALLAHGCTLIPEDVLRQPYDGTSDLARLRPGDPPSWWTRFFDYL